MTKAREHLTFEHAITRVAALIGYDGCADATGKGERIVRWWSDPDSDRCPCLADALALDQAYLAAGGTGAPILEIYTRLIEEAGASCFPLAEAMAASSAAIRKSGEFGADIVAAAQPGASPKVIAKAKAEAEDAATAFIEVARKLSAPGANARVVVCAGPCP